MSDFEGDVLLIETPDGGDVVVEDGLIKPCKDFSSAVYLSLFGGNKADDGKVKNSRTWWGNVLEDLSEDEKMISRFQAVVLGMPLSVKNMREAERAASLDLNWFIEKKIADEIKTSGRIKERNNFLLSVEIKKRR
ncbi:hypothetical protein [Treponema sp. OMZ 788]|uniref:hypothetical protein n=1 Tax=Treponema sp. OMZ 788 TaxID=2563664 RepID=UPI0020A55769|nr:hypothetical protein [Treponema sp. OMZ 788]